MKGVKNMLDFETVFMGDNQDDDFNPSWEVVQEYQKRASKKVAAHEAFLERKKAAKAAKAAKKEAAKAAKAAKEKAAKKLEKERAKIKKVV